MDSVVDRDSQQRKWTPKHNTGTVLEQAVSRKFGRERAEWWWTKFTAARRMRLKRMFHKQGGLCGYCGRPCYLAPDPGNQSRSARTAARNGLDRRQLATIEHIQLRSEGGSESPRNQFMACERCNADRNNTPYELFVEHALTYRELGKWVSFRKGWYAPSEEQLEELREANRLKREAEQTYALAVLCMISPEFKQQLDYEIQLHYPEKVRRRG